MKRVICLAAVVAAAAFVPSMTRIASQLVFAQGDQHAYFNALVARGEHWRSYSLRDAAQLNYRNQGGLIDSNATEGLWVTYNPGADSDRHRQDAAKIVIPAFRNWTTILTRHFVVRHVHHTAPAFLAQSRTSRGEPSRSTTRS